jgi:hypothetical protein
MAIDKAVVISKLRLLGLWALCFITTPLLLVAMLVQTLFGDEELAMSVAIAFDKCGNAALGGAVRMTVSAQVGKSYLKGSLWAVPVAWGIDLLMGKYHCIKTAAKY